MKKYLGFSKKSAAVLLVCVSLFCSSSVFAQAVAPAKPYAAYAAWVNKYRASYPDKRSTLATGKSGGLSPAYDVFWRAVLATEAYGGIHFRAGLPLQGSSDYPSYKNTISIGVSQARYDDGSPPYAFSVAKRNSPYLAGAPWNLQRYLWDPTYNAAIGYGYYAYMMGKANNNPCLAYAGYNGGEGGLNRYRKAGYRPVDKTTTMIHQHVASFVTWSKKLAGPHASEVDKVLRTSPGCTGNMDDVEPMPASSRVVEDRAEIEVSGYCDPIASKMLRDGFEMVQKDREETLEPLVRSIKTPPPASSSGSGSSGGASGGGVYSDSVTQLESCVSSSWPTASFSFPTMDQIIRGVAQQQVNKACGAARAKISAIRSKLTGQFYFNPQIPGVPSAGVSMFGSQDGGVIVNGSPQSAPPP